MTSIKSSSVDRTSIFSSALVVGLTVTETSLASTFLPHFLSPLLLVSSLRGLSDFLTDHNREIQIQPFFLFDSLLPFFSLNSDSDWKMEIGNGGFD
jgi:hypothetical protein